MIAGFEEIPFRNFNRQHRATSVSRDFNERYSVSGSSKGCVKLAPLCQVIIVLSRVLNYLEQKEEFLILFRKSSALFNNENKF